MGSGELYGRGLTLNEIILILFTSALPYLELRGSHPHGVILGRPTVGSLFPRRGRESPAHRPDHACSFLFSPAGLINTTFFIICCSGFRGRTAKQQEKINRYGFFGLTIFVAIPLPMTGVWTGAAIAHLLGIRKRRAVPALALGTVIAGIIVTLAALGIFAIW